MMKKLFLLTCLLLSGFILPVLTAVESSESVIKNIAIIVAMESEAQPMIEQLNMAPDKPIILLAKRGEVKFNVFSAQIGENKVHLVCNGQHKEDARIDNVGIPLAVLTTLAVVTQLQPDLIISAGTAGGLRDTKVGDIFLCNKELVYGDRYISLPGYEKYAPGHFNFIPVPLAAKKLDINLGVLGTTHSFDSSPQDISNLNHFRVDAVDMEAAAVAEIAEKFNVPMTALKIVVNHLNKNNHIDMMSNYDHCVKRLGEKVAQFVHFVIGKHPSELNAS